MLAASTLGSNVAPDNLQTAPVRALTGIAPDEFQKILTTGTLKSQPAQISEQHTARLQGRRYPFLFAINLLAIKDSNGSAAVDPNKVTVTISPLQIDELKTSGSDPDKTPHRPNRGIEVKRQNEDQTRSDKQSSRRQDDYP